MGLCDYFHQGVSEDGTVDWREKATDENQWQKIKKKKNKDDLKSYSSGKIYSRQYKYTV